MAPASQARLNIVQMPGKTRRSVACNHCRAKKIRCNGSIPCDNCVDRAEECVITRRRRPRTQINSTTNESILTQGNSNIHSETTTTDIPEDHVLAPPPSQENVIVSHSQPLISISQEPEYPRIATPEECQTSIDVFSNQDHGQEENSLYATDTINFEYYGPRCMMSFYSQPAVDWVDSKVKSPDYSSSVKRLVLESARMLKLNPEALSSCREPEPPPEVAWQYTNAYFEEGLDLAWGLVDRPLFESRLRAHFSGVNNPATDDKGWYALRNIIWAHGCQVFLSKTRIFHESLQSSWALFQNALSVHTEILFSHTSLIGVQALISMAYFSEGMGELYLQYTLCTDALRLACSKGLHRQPSHSWQIPPHEVKHRNWMFWSVYCLEKQICSRSGRPSEIMDDDEISCQVPQSALSGRQSDTLYCHTIIKMMQLASTAKKRLSSARALRQTTESLVQAVRTLKKDLTELKCSVQQHICLDSSIDAAQPPGGLTLRQAQSLQSHYFCLVLDINTPLTYPWLGISAYVADKMAVASEVRASFDEVARVSRSAILATRQINFDGGSSALISRYSPLYSFVNLFIHVLRDTTLPTVPSDLVLLDIALGYFSNLEFVTGLRLPRLFVREMCHFSRLAIEQKKETQENNVEKVISEETGESEVSQTADLMPASAALEDMSALPSFEQDFLALFPAEDLEMWSTLVPFEETHELMF